MPLMARHSWFPLKGGILDTRSSAGPTILNRARGSVPVPEELLRAGTANVTSLVHPNRNFAAYWAVVPEQANDEIRYPDALKHQFETVPDELRFAMVSHLEIFEKRYSMPPNKLHEIEVLDKQAKEIMKTKINPILDQIRESQLQAMEYAMKEFVHLTCRRTQ